MSLNAPRNVLVNTSLGDQPIAEPEALEHDTGHNEESSEKTGAV